MNPLVSVIVNCRNGEKYLREALDSIYAQSFQDFEIIFLDNLSTDNSKDIAWTYDSRLKYYSSSEPLALGAARNQAIRYATGEYLTFLDVDDLWMPDKLALQVQFFGTRPEFSFIYTNYCIFYQEKKIFKSVFEGMQPEGLIKNDIIFNYCIALVTVMVKRSALFSQEMLFDPVLEFYEEYDLFIRILCEHKAGYIPEVLAVWRNHQENITRNFMKANEYRYLIQRYKDEGLIQGQFIPRSYVRIMRIAFRDRDYGQVYNYFCEGISDCGFLIIIAGIKMSIEQILSNIRTLGLKYLKKPLWG